jgi:hypothetical protein
MLCDAINECAAKTASALQSLSTNHDPPPPAVQLTHSFDSWEVENCPLRTSDITYAEVSELYDDNLTRG